LPEQFGRFSTLKITTFQIVIHKGVGLELLYVNSGSV
jgi:hypothetical protein